MQKTVLALALASVFSVGTSVAAPTALTGTGSDPLLSGDYQLTGDYILKGSASVMASGITVNLNGHNLTISSDAVTNPGGGQGTAQGLTITGNGNVDIKHTGTGDVITMGCGTTKILANNIGISSESTYSIWVEPGNIDLATNEAKGNINISSKNQSAIYMTAASTLNIHDFDELRISTTSETDHGHAISNNGGTLTISGGKVFLSADKRSAFVNQDNTANTTIKATSLNVTANIDGQTDDRKVGAFAVGAGVVNVEVGSLDIKTTEGSSQTNKTHGIYLYQTSADEGQPTLNITAKNANVEGNVTALTGKGTVTADILKVTGDLDVRAEADMPLSFAGVESNLTGTATVAGTNTLSFVDQAKWTVTGESTVSNLALDNAKVDMSGTDKNVTADNLTGTAGNVVMDAKGTNTFTVTNETTTKVTALASQDADSVNVEEAKKMVDRIGGQVSDKSAAVNEGAYNGAISVDGQGNVTIRTNSLMEDTLTLGGSSLLSLNRILMNDVRKRMGDVRAMEGTTGAWARYDGGRLSATGLENDFNTIQVGADTLVPNTNWRVGLAASYTKGDHDFRRGSADLDAYMLTGYGLWMADNGMFVDVVARLAKAENDMTVDGGAKAGKLDNRAHSLSGEFGWRFDLSNQYYVEPQAELTYTCVDSEDLDLGSAQYKFDSMTSFLGRVGVATGIKCPNNKGDLYFRVSAVHEFDGDAKITGANGTSLTQDGKDTWVEYGIGGNFNLTTTTYFWADLERTAGATLETDWRATFGVRHAF